MLAILYQIVLSLIMSALIEIVLRRQQKSTLNKMLENIQIAKKEIWTMPIVETVLVGTKGLIGLIKFIEAHHFGAQVVFF